MAMRPLTRDYGGLTAACLLFSLATPPLFLGIVTPLISLEAAATGRMFAFLADAWAWSGGRTPHIDRPSDC